MLTFEQIEACFPPGAVSTEACDGIIITAQWVHDFAHAIESAAIAAVDAERSKEAIATLHDDGYWTTKNANFRHQSSYAGWRQDVFLSPTIPAGYALVPIDVTDAMLEAWKNQLMIPVGSSPESKARRAYKAMISAAPTAQNSA